MIDWSRVAELREEIGADDFGEVVEIFLEEVQSEIDALRGDVAPGNLEDKLHFLKGSALNLGFREFSDLCQSGEAAAGAGRMDLIDMQATVASFDRSKAEFVSGMDRLNTA
ncbi:Hpt domain-containing protein [Roseovarius sp. LXJ103]|uniref:Hpt domain-containing protein n=1 Tax=Roseovarius carneus TaxID=2853164 RepID=UPI000D60B56A|nr:Hpt domain-containing protein [Roseovarius carneus]MBZ8117902.1 Hpt domain-containing protein [Roseovarius carneus]PWE36342.1 histidine kinase [Pelagicola sp. LXJ1103]